MEKIKAKIIIDGKMVDLVEKSKDRRSELYDNFMDLTISQIEEARRCGIDNLTPDMIRAIRESVQALQCF